MRALLTGASGFVGSHVLEALVRRGDEVRCLLRQRSSRDNLAGFEAEIVTGDLRDGESLRTAVRGCEVVFHCAADYRLFVRDPREMYASNVEGTRDLLRIASEAGVGRIVYTSSVGALGLDPEGRPATEDTPVSLVDMVGHYKRSKFLAERAAEEAAASGVPVVIVNPSTPVGERDVKPTATGRIIVDFLRGQVPAYVDTGLNLIDVRDVATGHLLAAERGRVGERYILGNENLTLLEIYGMLGEIAGRRPPRVKVPHWLPIGVAALDTGMARLLRREPRIPLEAALLARYKMYFDAAKARRELTLPQTPVREALRRAVDWFSANGYLNGSASDG